MASTALWVFVHRALSPHFLADSKRFVRTLDGGDAVRYLDDMWRWALSTVKQNHPSKPPLNYAIVRPREDLVVVGMHFRGVEKTGEPWEMRLIARDSNPDGTGGYTRVFLLEHSEYLTGSNQRSTALICENEPNGSHKNWGAVLPTDDVRGFDAFVSEKLRAAADTASGD